MTLIFFHFPIYTYIVGLVILFIFFRVTRKYNLIKYLKKELKARPQEKISNIINTDQSNYSRYELGKNLILTPLIIDFAKHYKASIDGICGKTNKLYIDNSEQH